MEESAGYASSAEHNVRRHQTAMRWGLLVSVGLHAAVFLLWRSDLQPLPGTVAAGLRSGDAFAAAAGVMEAIALMPPREILIPPPPEPVPDLDAPEVRTEIPQERELTASFADLTGGATFIGERVGPGLPDASGRGDGGVETEGRFRLTAPEPRSIIPEWDPPGEVKGMQVMVRVLVDRFGEPTGEVELRPRTPNARFNRRLIEKVLQMDYRPARDRLGSPVSAWAEMTFVF
jgi:hypothetical protein